MNKRVQLLIIPIPEIVCPESFEIGIKKLSNIHSFIYAFSMENMLKDQAFKRLQIIIIAKKPPIKHLPVQSQQKKQ